MGTEESKSNKYNNQGGALGWRWVWVTIVALSVTAFFVAWVKVTQINANKDVRIQEIQHNQSSKEG